MIDFRYASHANSFSNITIYPNVYYCSNTCRSIMYYSKNYDNLKSVAHIHSVIMNDIYESGMRYNAFFECCSYTIDRALEDYIYVEFGTDDTSGHRNAYSYRLYDDHLSYYVDGWIDVKYEDYDVKLIENIARIVLFENCPSVGMVFKQRLNEVMNEDNRSRR